LARSLLLTSIEARIVIVNTSRFRPPKGRAS
jgi:hypothetical protein